jgi:hypothetical protein
MLANLLKSLIVFTMDSRYSRASVLYPPSPHHSCRQNRALDRRNRHYPILRPPAIRLGLRGCRQISLARMEDQASFQLAQEQYETCRTSLACVSGTTGRIRLDVVVDRVVCWMVRPGCDSNRALPKRRRSGPIAELLWRSSLGEVAALACYVDILRGSLMEYTIHVSHKA